MPSIRCTLGTLVFLAVSTPKAVVAQTRAPGLSLDYRVVGNGCPNEGEFRDLVASRLGVDPFDRGGARQLTITSEPAGQGTLEVRVALPSSGGTASASKVFRGHPRQCAELLHRAALAVALVLEDDAPQPSTSEPASEAIFPSPTPPAEPARSPPTPPEAVRGATHQAVTSVGVSTSLHVGGAGLHPGAALEFVFAHRFGVMSLGAVGRTVLPTQDTFSVGRVSTTTVGGGLMLCAGSRRVGVCVPVTVGAVVGAGGEVPAAREDVSPFVTIGVRPEVQLLGGDRLELTAFVEGYWAPSVTSFHFRAGEAWSTSPVGAMIGLSGRMNLP